MMNKILWHAVSISALVRTRPENNAPVVKSVSNGIWLGVMAEMGEWIYVVGKEAIGWVLRKEIETCNAQALHIREDEAGWMVGY